MISLRKEERQYNDADSSSIRDRPAIRSNAPMQQTGYSIRMLPGSMRKIVLRLFFQATALGIYP
ncbi:hypothetical protein H0178_42885 [Cytobacillus firmus]|nr:hypothetical protein [Cytobacillus firmus]